MKRLAMLGLAVIVLFPPSQTIYGEPQGKNLSKFMVEKLRSAQRLLEGIALADFNKVTSSAEDLIQYSKQAEWAVFKTPRYELFTNEFRRAAENVIQKSKGKNIDGVTLSYFEMTMACVRCHQYVREVRDARLPDHRPLIVNVGGKNP